MNKICGVLLFLLLLTSSVFAYQEDYLVNNLIDKNIKKPVQNLNYNYQSTFSIPIRLRVVNKIKSDKDLYEGQIIDFIVSEDVIWQDKIVVKKGEIATARVETIIANGMNGIPASVVFGNFCVQGLPNNKISQKYEHFGLDLSLFVFPLKWALTPFPPTGSLTNFIKGGRVSLSQNKVVQIYYFPEW